MRYSFDQEAWSMVNRILDVFVRSGSINGLTTKQEEEAFNASRGWSADYGYKNGVLLAALWTAADLNMDWGGDTEAIYDTGGKYPTLAKAWLISLGWDTLDGKMPEPYHKAEDAIHDAVMIASTFENKLYLACLVANAIEALDQGVRNVWSTIGLLEAINKEFSAEQERVREEAYTVIRPWAETLFAKAFAR